MKNSNRWTKFSLLINLVHYLFDFANLVKLDFILFQVCTKYGLDCICRMSEYWQNFIIGFSEYHIDFK